MYIQPCLGENLIKLLFSTIQFIDSTRPKFEVCPTNSRSSLNLGRPKIEFDSSNEKFDVWPRL